MSPRKRKYIKRKKGIFSSLKQDKNIDLELSPDTRREIIGFSLIGTSIIFLLFSLGFAGKVGVVLYDVFQMVIGWSTITIPFFLFYFGLSFLKPEKFELKPVSLIGIALFIVSFSSLVHLFFAYKVDLEQVRLGVGGGYLGYGIISIFDNLFGYLASIVIFIALLISSILITFNTTTEKIIEKFNEFKKDKEREKNLNINTPEEFKAEQKPLISLKNKPILQDEESSEISFSSSKISTISDKNWKLPSTDLLSNITSPPDSGNVNENAKKIEDTLSQFNINVKVKDANVGPTVTQYTIKPEDGVKLNKITNLNDNLALALAAHPIRIEAPIPGLPLVGIEVPNKTVSTVRLRGLLEDNIFQKNRKSNLTLVLGRDVSGSPAYANLDSMPHLLIAGSTGSGKSVCINTVLLSLLYQNSPKDLKLLLIDPKGVEMTAYEGIPHLLTSVIKGEPEKAVNALAWAVNEMENRFAILSQKGKKDIHAYNAEYKDEKLPFIVIVIDELAELMMTTAKEIESSIVRIAQKARATGIHLIVATQRPEADVVTGLIKANMPCKIAFAVSSALNSRIIIDSPGAEKLIGKGDMLYQASDVGKPKRIQGALVEESEINKVVDFIKNQQKAEYDDNITEKHTDSSFVGVGSDEDPILDSAIETVVDAQRASATLLQTRLRIGYAKAARLLDLMEKRGIVGPHNGSKSREIYVKSIEELYRLKEQQKNEYSDDFVENDDYKDEEYRGN
ncbi:MAG: DNA translocase FtsK 4TM domain-containing protein [Candidatus Woesearchaeota archaeon]